MDSGSIEVVLHRAAGQISQVHTRLQRPRLAPLLTGKSAAQAMQLVPLLYAVCAHAQAAAASAACAAARGDATPAQCRSEVRAEAAGELALSLLRGSASTWVSAARRAAVDPSVLTALLEHELLGMTCDAWLGLESAPALLHWAHASEAPLARECRWRAALAEPRPYPVHWLSAPSAADTQSAWPPLSAVFAQAPTLADGPAETGPAARLAALPVVAALQERPLLQHWIARLVELVHQGCATIPSCLGRVSAVTCGVGRGRAAVETARGTLLHEVTLHHERIVDYIIVAPTEWNFHPQGSLRTWLTGMPAATDEDALALAARAVEALDPCVDCRYRVAAASMDFSD